MRLLERIRNMARTPAERRETDDKSIQDSILQHLIRLLNTRQGSSMLAPDYGMPDLSALWTSETGDSMRRIEDILTHVVSRYEPRLRDVSVRFLRDRKEPSQLSFALTATMAIPELRDERTMYLQTVLTPSGRIRVRRYRDDEADVEGRAG